MTQRKYFTNSLPLPIRLIHILFITIIIIIMITTYLFILIAIVTSSINSSITVKSPNQWRAQVCLFRTVFSRARAPGVPGRFFELGKQSNLPLLLTAHAQRNLMQLKLIIKHSLFLLFKIILTHLQYMHLL